SGEPSTQGGRTVWWRWTTAYASNYVFDTFGTAFDTTIGVFTGTALTNLTRVAFNDDWNGTVQSQVRLVGAAGTTYYIGVDGYGGAEGEILLNWQWDTTPPANDNFASATVISGLFGVAYGDGANATVEPYESDYPNQTVWWRWTAPSNGCCSFYTFGSESGAMLD